MLSLSGIGAGPGETLQPSIIADIYFLHDRGKWNTMYWVIYTGALIVSYPLVGIFFANKFRSHLL